MCIVHMRPLFVVMPHNTKYILCTLLRGSKRHCREETTTIIFYKDKNSLIVLLATAIVIHSFYVKDAFGASLITLP